MSIKYCSLVLAAVVAALLFSSMPLLASEKPNIIRVSGEIALIDIKLGKLQLESDSSRDRRDPIEYRINQNNTRVTDPTDKKFLKLEDLQVGQHVTVESDYYMQGKWDRVPIAQKIVANPMSQKAFPRGSTNTVTTTTTSTTTTP